MISIPFFFFFSCTKLLSFYLWIPCIFSENNTKQSCIIEHHVKANIDSVAAEMQILVWDIADFLSYLIF